MAAQRKQSELNLKTKPEVVKELEQGKSNKEVANQYNILGYLEKHKEILTLTLKR